jgi:hypothetical protein
MHSTICYRLAHRSGVSVAVSAVQVIELYGCFKHCGYCSTVCGAARTLLRLQQQVNHTRFLHGVATCAYTTGASTAVPSDCTLQQTY